MGEPDWSEWNINQRKASLWAYLCADGNEHAGGKYRVGVNNTTKANWMKAVADSIFVPNAVSTTDFEGKPAFEMDIPVDNTHPLWSVSAGGKLINQIPSEILAFNSKTAAGIFVAAIIECEGQSDPDGLNQTGNVWGDMADHTYADSYVATQKVLAQQFMPILLLAMKTTDTLVDGTDWDELGYIADDVNHAYLLPSGGHIAVHVDSTLWKDPAENIFRRSVFGETPYFPLWAYGRAPGGPPV